MFSKDFASEKAIYELDKIDEIEQRISRNDLIYKTGTKKKDKTYQNSKQYDVLEERFIVVFLH